MISEIHSDREDKRGLVLVWIQDVTSKAHLLEGEAGEHAALNLAIRLVQPRPLSHHPEPKPLGGRQRQLRPVVEETVRGIGRVEDILSLAVEFELQPTDRA